MTRICTGCKKHCYNSCAKAAHGWCADCRDATGDSICNDCRAKEAAARAQRVAARQQSKAASVAAQGYVPSYVPPVPQPIPASHTLQAQRPQPGLRKALYLMTEPEVESWIQSIDVALSDLRGRTVTTHDNVVVKDLQEALQELRILWRMAHTQVSSGPDMGMLVEYDYSQGKVTP